MSEIKIIADGVVVTYYPPDDPAEQRRLADEAGLAEYPFATAEGAAQAALAELARTIEGHDALQMKATDLLNAKAEVAERPKGPTWTAKSAEVALEQIDAARDSLAAGILDTYPTRRAHERAIACIERGEHVVTEDGVPMGKA